ncbi:hypothetical protein [Acidaminococcus fermentans]|uniref:hypothetical protein n=1 Tax=Acidaminococcus fermentans TaxID=905 RepID=UPI00241C3ECC|nr:hypothetical protein [Acidaminococcus fermentans]
MALYNKAGQTVQEVQQEGQKQEIQQQLETLKQEVEALRASHGEMKEDITAASRSQRAGEQELLKKLNFIRTQQKKTQQIICLLITGVTVCVSLTVAALSQSKKNAEITERKLDNIQAILQNEKVFWYDEESQQLYLDQQEKIRQQIKAQ